MNAPQFLCKIAEHKIHCIYIHVHVFITIQYNLRLPSSYHLCLFVTFRLTSRVSSSWKPTILDTSTMVAPAETTSWSATSGVAPTNSYTTPVPYDYRTLSTGSAGPIPWGEAWSACLSSARIASLAKTAYSTSITRSLTDLFWPISMDTRVCQNCIKWTPSTPRKTSGANRGFWGWPHTPNIRTSLWVMLHCGIAISFSNQKTGFQCIH